MDVEVAFLLGFVIGQWVAIFVVWNTWSKLAKALSSDSQLQRDKPPHLDRVVYLTARIISETEED